VERRDPQVEQPRRPEDDVQSERQNGEDQQLGQEVGWDTEVGERELRQGRERGKQHAAGRGISGRERHTFSRERLPRSPVGRKMRSTNNPPKKRASTQLPGKYPPPNE